MSRPRFPPHQGGYSNLVDAVPPSPGLSPRTPHAYPVTPPGSPRASPLRMQQDPFADRSADPSRLSPTSPRTPREYAERVARGEIGGAYGPYSPPPRSSSRSPGPDGRRDPFADSAAVPRSAPPSPPSLGRRAACAAHHQAAAQVVSSGGGGGAKGADTYAPLLGGGGAYTAKEAALDERLHTYAPGDRLAGGGSWRAFSLRGWLNLLALVAIAGGLITIFAGYPIADWARKHTRSGYSAYSLGGAVRNSTGQVPDIPNLPGLIDKDTPEAAMTRIGNDGEKYVLVFSDEFNTDGRTFWPGDDPYWEAVDIHYWPTGDLEWYDPDAVTTKDGNLVITITEEPVNGLNFRSGMLQSWNKFCFTGGYIEVSISLPGTNDISGFWPGAWTLGNLARAGYGATTDGTWPYAYNSCDLGTLANQTNVDGTGPAAALKTSSGASLSYQPGQRVSACTCPADKDEHPGPNVKVGRGAPEIDIIEAQTYWTGKKLVGAVSQSAQFAPYDADYEIRNSTPYVRVYDDGRTIINEYKGGIYQQACSGITTTDTDAYQDAAGDFASYGFEYQPSVGDDGFITWYSSGEPSWTLTSGAVGPNTKSGVAQRTISTEPMSVILNLGISDSFQTINYEELVLPGTMLVDYVRVFQRENAVNVGCDPKEMPTANYIEKHMNAYQNPNLTTWEQAGYEYPRNSMKDTC
ncbi:hypothetical protein JCM10450v2_006266 [Rhodotorula kratochvilovae]